MLRLLQPKPDFFEAGHCENSLCNLWSRRTAGKACSVPGAKAEGAQIGLACRGAVLPQRVMHGCACQPGAWDVGMNLALWVSHRLLGDHAIRGHSRTGSSHSVSRTGA